MESLLLFRRAFSSPTMCRFIPALSVHEILVHETLHETLCHQDPDYRTKMRIATSRADLGAGAAFRGRKTASLVNLYSLTHKP